MIILQILSLLIIAYGLRRKAGYLLLPTLIGVLWLLWFLPQLSELIQDSSVPASGLNRLIVMMALSLMAFWIGWYTTSRRVAPRPPADLSRLLPGAVLLTILSVAINVLLNRYRAEMAGVQQWSGPITIISFFAQIRDIALPLTLLLFLGQRSRLAALLLLANLMITLPIAFTLLRRSEILGLGAGVLAAFWFARRWQVSLLILAPTTAAFTVVAYVIGPLRGASRAMEELYGERPFILDPKLWQSIDFRAAGEHSLSKAHDLRNAVYLIDYCADEVAYKFGATIWNGLVKLYIPGQIFGYDFKRSLYFDRNTAYESIFDIYGYKNPIGTTSTGFGSAFSDFGYLGALYFVFMAVALKRMFAHAVAGDIWAQVSYICFLPLVLISMTHGHIRFFISAPYLLVVIWMLRKFANYRFHTHNRSVSPPVLKGQGQP